MSRRIAGQVAITTTAKFDGSRMNTGAAAAWIQSERPAGHAPRQALGTWTPASAVADRIFNDPESWNAETRLGLTKDDVAAWDMLDQFPEVPSGPDSADFTLKPFTSKFRLTPRPDLRSPESELESDTETTMYTWEGVKAKEKGDEVPVIDITFSVERPGKEKVTPLDRMSILWAHGNLFRAFPSPLGVSPPASASPATETPLHHSTPTPRSAFVPHPSPLRAASKSATWGILEYYGVSPPNTPRTADALPPSQLSSSARSLRVPSRPSRPPPPVPSLPATVAKTRPATSVPSATSRASGLKDAYYRRSRSGTLWFRTASSVHSAAGAAGAYARPPRVVEPPAREHHNVRSLPPTPPPKDLHSRHRTVP
ncbi:hypothetical protein B0H13DRAFT_2404774 [Mycena leptocephala]|nr:hypothetical protein B0H13DRAFT_2404774 [Mycena leptocephala]